MNPNGLAPLPSLGKLEFTAVNETASTCHKMGFSTLLLSFSMNLIMDSETLKTPDIPGCLLK